MKLMTRGGSRAAATSKMEHFVIIVNGLQPLTIITKRSILDVAAALDPPLDDYKVLRCDRNRHGGGVACYIRNELSYNIISVFQSEIESVFFEILLPNFKPITIGTIYCPLNQSNSLEVLNENMNKIGSISNETYILGNFNINLSLNDSLTYL